MKFTRIYLLCTRGEIKFDAIIQFLKDRDMIRKDGIYSRHW